MNLTDRYRDTLDELTRDRPGEVDLSAVIRGGRRRRRVRRTAWAGGALAVAAVAATTAVVLHHDTRVVAVDQGPAAGPSYQDFVAGTDVDETLQATVARHLASLPAATEVYPSDWNHPDPIAAFGDATEWHALYDVSPAEHLRVVMSEPIPGQPVDLRCRGLEQADIPCRRVVLGDGSVETRSGYVLGSSTYRFLTMHVTPQGFITETLDDVRADSVEQARATRQLTDGALSSLVRDPALTFPAPLRTPPSPDPQM